jgi:hypothetical protein
VVLEKDGERRWGKTILLVRRASHPTPCNRRLENESPIDWRKRKIGVREIIFFADSDIIRTFAKNFVANIFAIIKR